MALLAGCTYNGTSRAQFDITQYSTAAFVFFSTNNPSPHFSKDSNTPTSTLTIDGLDASVGEVYFALPDFSYPINKQWDLYWKGGWTLDAENVKTLNGFDQDEQSFSYK